jgi:hypothetical protein
MKKSLLLVPALMFMSVASLFAVNNANVYLGRYASPGQTATGMYIKNINITSATVTTVLAANDVRVGWKIRNTGKTPVYISTDSAVTADCDYAWKLNSATDTATTPGLENSISSDRWLIYNGAIYAIGASSGGVSVAGDTYQGAKVSVISTRAE